MTTADPPVEPPIDQAEPGVEPGEESDPIPLSRRSQKSRAGVAATTSTSTPTVTGVMMPEPPSSKKNLAQGALAMSAAVRALWRSPAALSRKLGFAGLLVAAMLGLLAVFADLFASDLPVACRWHGSTFVLPNITRPGELAEVDRQDLVREADWLIPAVVSHGPKLAPGEVVVPLLSPRGGHPLGTDVRGRDVFARVVHGARGYLLFAIAAVAASGFLGALLGAVAGLFGGATDTLVSRIIESVSAFPPLVLVIGIQAAVSRATLLTLFFAIALTRWPEIARLVRGEVLHATTRDYVVAARALGASPLRILRRHIAPNVRAPLVVAATLGVSAVVLTEAALDFLHIGAPADAASWGETMSQFREAPSAWWLLAFPGVLLVVTIVAYNLFGEMLRGELDEHAR